MDDFQAVHALATTIRRDALAMVYKAKSSHIGSCFSMADILAVLYGAPIVRHDPKQPDWQERDIVLVSKGHAAAIMYALLGELGYFDKELLDHYCKNGYVLQGHLSHHVAGIELSTGSLGHALSVGCGWAISAKRSNHPRRVFVILSDGELDEGSNWEAILFAGHQKLSNLTVIVDYNKIQSFGTTAEVLNLEPLADKWRACNWHVQEVDGHDKAALAAALSDQRALTDLPSVVIAHTIKGKGVDFMEGKLEWHYKSPSPEQFEQASKQLEAAQ